MNSSHVSGTSPQLGTASADPAVAPAGWSEAVAAMVKSRLGIIQIESKKVISQLVRCLIFIVIACVGAFFGYAFLIAGLVTLIANKAHWPWAYVALGAALIHLVVAGILGMLAKPALAGAFAVTRAEFQKDSEWLKNFQKTKNSNG